MLYKRTPHPAAVADIHNSCLSLFDSSHPHSTTAARGIANPPGKMKVATPMFSFQRNNGRPTKVTMYMETLAITLTAASWMKVSESA
jgi:hypothetical protein